ncbi:MAG: DUF502 domain-containing protein [Ignavibacteriae bacterium]|nr:DUF502 domain-containing protein [Ignavibacteriota bacterium]
MTDTIEEKQSRWEMLRGTFGRGLVVIVPAVITVWVLNILFSAVDGIISPLFDEILQRHIPGLGFVTMIVLIFIVGFLSRNLFGAWLFRSFERVIASIPLARTIYTAMKDLINAFQPGGKGKSFRRVVLIEYPRLGLSTIGFVTNELLIKADGQGDDMISVYIPNPPNPTSGMLVLVPKHSARTLDMSVEEGLKLVLSGGIVTSGSIMVK